MQIAKISVGAAIMLAALVCNSQGAARLTTIYQSASGPDALVPTSVLSDGNGGFYGTMTSGAQMGEVFHLTPPAETGGPCLPRPRPPAGCSPPRPMPG